MRTLAVVLLTLTVAGCTRELEEPPAARAPAPAVARRPVVPPPPPVSPTPLAPPAYERHGAFLSSDGMGAQDPDDDLVIITGGRTVYDADFHTIYSAVVQLRNGVPGWGREHARVLTADEEAALAPRLTAALAETPGDHRPIPDQSVGMLVWAGAGPGHALAGVGGFDPAGRALANALDADAAVKVPRPSAGLPRAKLPAALRASAPQHGIVDLLHHLTYDRDAGTITDGLTTSRVSDDERGQLVGAIAAGWDAPAGDGVVLLDGASVRLLDATAPIAARTIAVLRH